MNWKDWKEKYLEIVRDMGYSTAREMDALRAGVNAAMLERNVLKGHSAISRISGAIKDECVVVGGGPSLDSSLGELRDLMEGRSTVAADGACGRLLENGIIPDVIVTDADGDLPSERRMNSMSSALVLHFHGDNYRRAYDFSRTLQGDVVITTQAGPTEWTFNFGGFTDGDRAVLMCEEFGASSVYLVGFDFPSWTDAAASKKLHWAKRIIQDAEERGLNVQFAAGSAGDD